MQILQMFQRKVHPESSMAERKSNKPHKNDINNKIIEEGCYSNEDQVLPDEDIMIFPQRTLSKESQRSFKSHSDPPKSHLVELIQMGTRNTGSKQMQNVSNLRSQNPLYVPDFLDIIILP